MKKVKVSPNHEDKGKRITLDESRDKIDAGPHWDQVLTEMEMEDATAPRRSLTFALGVLEDLSRAARHYLESPIQRNRNWLVGAVEDAQLVLRSKIVDTPRVNIDPPTTDGIKTEVKAVRRARKKRSMEP